MDIENYCILIRRVLCLNKYILLWVKSKVLLIFVEHIGTLDNTGVKYIHII